MTDGEWQWRCSLPSEVEVWICSVFQTRKRAILGASQVNYVSRKRQPVLELGAEVCIYMCNLLVIFSRASHANPYVPTRASVRDH
jgi:hypothetical protein